MRRATRRGVLLATTISLRRKKSCCEGWVHTSGAVKDFAVLDHQIFAGFGPIECKIVIHSVPASYVRNQWLVDLSHYGSAMFE